MYCRDQAGYGLDKERQYSIAKLARIGRAHIQNDPALCVYFVSKGIQ